MARYKKENDRVDIYQIVTDRIIEKLEAGAVPWKHFCSAPLSVPKNLATGKPYRGVNRLLLSMDTRFSSPYWLTFNQASGRGGRVKKGEKSTPIVFWKSLQKEDAETGELKNIPVLRYYLVFNVEQCDGIEYPNPYATDREAHPVDAAEDIIAGMPNPPVIVIDDAPRARYFFNKDEVHVPSARVCVSDERYYEVFLHELVHSTGHASRLNRFAEEGNTHEWGSTPHVIEELVAEIGSAFLCAQAGIFQSLEDDLAAYIASWMGRLKKDKHLIVKAAGKAQKAADYIYPQEVVAAIEELVAA
jgi:antirestriction protein ArdC